MGLPDRVGQAWGGPRGGTSWEDLGDSFTLQNHTTISATTSAPGLFPAYTVTRRNPFYNNSGIAQSLNSDNLDQTDLIQTCYGFQVSSSVVQAPLTNLTITLSVYRTIGTLAVNPNATVTSLILSLPLTQTIVTGSSVQLTNVTTGAVTTLTTSGSSPAGGTTLNITSTAINIPVGSTLTWQVGNTYAFGWLGVSSGSGGTPAFPVGGSILAPANTSNPFVVVGPTGAGWFAQTTIQTGFIPVQEGDVLMINTLTATGTATVNVLNIQPLIT
jgi:hypothetical protein